jgi:hypothetical protein
MWWPWEVIFGSESPRTQRFVRSPWCQSNCENGQTLLGAYFHASDRLAVSVGFFAGTPRRGFGSENISCTSFVPADTPSRCSEVTPDTPLPGVPETEFHDGYVLDRRKLSKVRLHHFAKQQIGFWIKNWIASIFLVSLCESLKSRSDGREDVIRVWVRFWWTDARKIDVDDSLFGDFKVSAAISSLLQILMYYGEFEWNLLLRTRRHYVFHWNEMARTIASLNNQYPIAINWQYAEISWIKIT